MRQVSHYIARRIAFGQGKSFTKVIIRIAVVSIALSLSIMLLTTAIIAGFKKEITEKIFGFWGHIQITDSNVNRNFELAPIPSDDPVYTKIRDIRQIEYEKPFATFGHEWKNYVQPAVTSGGVAGVYPYIIMPAIMNTKENLYGVLLKGVAQDYDWRKLESFIVDGSKISYQNDTASSEVLVSKIIAEKLIVKTGDKVILSFIKDQERIKKRFTVCGIYNTGLEEYDRRFCIVDIQKLQEVLGWNVTDVQGMEVVLDDVQDLDVISEYIYYEELPAKLYATTIRSKFPGIFEWLDLQDINETIITILMIIVAIINMVTVLLILILERTPMIGTLKALGMNNWNVRKIFLYNALYIIGLGLIFGNILGIGVALLQKKFKFITLDEANYYLSVAPIKLEWGTILLLNVGTILITLMFLILPTYLVTKITPVKVLRFE